ncbi:MAG: O-antigen ligase family protein [Candidatus Krumholzibacteriia bacterium]
MTAWLTGLPLLLFGAACTVSTAAGNVGAGLLIAAALAAWARHRRRLVDTVPREVLLALGALYLTHALATLLAHPGPMRWGKLGEEMWFKLLVVSVPLVAAGRPRLVLNAIRLTLAAAVITAGYALWQNVSGQDPWRGRPLLHTAGHAIATGFHSHHLSYGGQAMLSLALAMAWLREDLLTRPRRLWLPFAVCAALGAGLIGSFARSAQLGAFAAAVFLVTTLPGRWRRAGVGSLVGLLVIAAVLPAVRLRVIEGFTDEKEVTRPNLWRSSLAGIAHRPLLGWGPGNFRVMLAEHEVPGYYESRAHSHNDYLMHAVNAGVLGLAAALWLLWATVRHLHRGWRRGGPGSWVMLGALAAQVSVAVAGLFQVYQTDDEPEMLLYFLVGCGLALLTAQRDGASASASASAPGA